MEQRKCENADDMKQNKRRQERAFLNFESSNSALWRRVLTKKMFLLWRILSDSLYLDNQEVPMHKNRFLTLRYANNDRHKGALSSVRAHSFV
ncbi:hypothetical protein T05_15393 [Trichinella murrelli]|uniref:Uncharacterized protein n=1 Tax=Trichinella murrelli TaxID=144512 RepID=A0A0V0U6J9_9BILA|nr:hypothetical protein T05_15393 [Trichinella murrelli]